MKIQYINVFTAQDSLNFEKPMGGCQMKKSRKYIPRTTSIKELGMKFSTEIVDSISKSKKGRCRLSPTFTVTAHSYLPSKGQYSVSENL